MPGSDIVADICLQLVLRCSTAVSREKRRLKNEAAAVLSLFTEMGREARFAAHAGVAHRNFLEHAKRESNFSRSWLPLICVS